MDRGVNGNFLLRLWLITASAVTSAVSLIFLFMFSLPHYSWAPEIPGWRDVAPDLLEQLHPGKGWQPEDAQKIELLMQITDIVGSIGYERTSFYFYILPYWDSLLAISSIFSFFMLVSSILMLWYLLYKYQLQYLYCPVPWIFLNSILLLTILFVLGWLLGDISDPFRLKLELSYGTIGNYALLITILLFLSIFICMEVTGAIIHLEDKIIEYENEKRLSNILILDDISFIYEENL